MGNADSDFPTFTPDLSRVLAGLVQAEWLARTLHHHWVADACRAAHQIITDQPA